MRNVIFYEFNWAHFVSLNNPKFKFLAGYCETTSPASYAVVHSCAHDMLQVCLDFEHFQFLYANKHFTLKKLHFGKHIEVYY